MGKIIPAAKVKKGPAIIIKKITIMNNETVYYGIINHKALSPNEMDEMMELFHEVVSEVWVRISAGGKKIEFCLSSEVPNY